LPLDRGMKELVERVIQNDLTALEVPKKRIPKLNKIWKCDHTHDFLRQQGSLYKGLAAGLMLERHKRELTQGEDEVFEIVEPYTRALRQYFAFFKEERCTRRLEPDV
jgi:hypothetical protein